MDDSKRPNTTVYVAGLDTTYVNQSTLSEVFIPFGEITSVNLPKPTLASDPAPHRGFGYVEFEEASDAKEAIANMDQSELYGRVIKVTWAREDRKIDETPGEGSTVAVWEKEGYAEKYGGQDAIEIDNHEQENDPMQGLEDLDVAGPRNG